MSKIKITQERFDQLKQKWFESQKRIAERSFKGNGVHGSIGNGSTPYLEHYIFMIRQELASRSGKKYKRDKHAYWDRFEVV